MEGHHDRSGRGPGEAYRDFGIAGGDPPGHGCATAVAGYAEPPVGPVVQKKVCLLGAYAAGKTSLASRFVQGIFSERYKTTVGVKIDRRDLVVGDRLARLLVWDLHGEDTYQRVKGAYLRGTAGCLVVVDGTRRGTLHTALRLIDWARGITGPVPYALLLNKTDLDRDWEVDPETVRAGLEPDCALFETSARTGAGVDAAFLALAARMLED